MLPCSAGVDRPCDDAGAGRADDQVAELVEQHVGADAGCEVGDRAGSVVEVHGRRAEDRLGRRAAFGRGRRSGRRTLGGRGRRWRRWGACRRARTGTVNASSWICAMRSFRVERREALQLMPDDAVDAKAAELDALDACRRRSGCRARACSTRRTAARGRGRVLPCPRATGTRCRAMPGGGRGRRGRRSAVPVDTAPRSPSRGPSGGRRRRRR